MIRLLLLSFILGSSLLAVTPTTSTPKKILLIAGAKSHAPGEHEHALGCKLLAEALNHSNLPILADVSLNWPPSSLDPYDAIVIYADGMEHHPALHHCQEIQSWLQAGKGISFLHWSIEPDRPELLSLLSSSVGGYFDTPTSVNPIWKLENPCLATHPITHGVHPFSITDEIYFNLKFPNGNSSITPILSAIPPTTSIGDDGPRSGNPEIRSAVAQKKLQTLAWCFQAPNNARGFAFSGGHYHHNWQNRDLRTLILNAIAWTAHLPIPDQGTTHPDPLITKYPTIEQAITKGDLDDVTTHFKINPNSIHSGSSTTAKSPLETALLRNQTSICSWLLEHGANPNPPTAKRPLTIIAIERKNLPALKLLIQAHANVNATDSAGWSPLHHAAAKNQADAIQALLLAHANPNQLSQLGGTPLHEAAASANQACITLLLNAHCNPHIRSSQGLTALDIAKQFQNLEAISTLSNLTISP